MTRPRSRTRELTTEEIELWRIVTANVRPRLPRRPAPAAKPAPAKPVPAPPAHKALDHRPHKPDPAQKPVLAIDRRASREIARGKLDIDARLDLHGFRVAEAHTRVVDFLLHAQRRGARVVLIVTGKGARPTSPGGWSSDAEVGVLRRQTPLWLSDPRLRHVVAAFGEAAQAHGGAGALYVRIRRPQGSAL